MLARVKIFEVKNSERKILELLATVKIIRFFFSKFYVNNFLFIFFSHFFFGCFTFFSPLFFSSSCECVNVWVCLCVYVFSDRKMFEIQKYKRFALEITLLFFFWILLNIFSRHFLFCSFFKKYSLILLSLCYEEIGFSDSSFDHRKRSTWIEN